MTFCAAKYCSIFFQYYFNSGVRGILSWSYGQTLLILSPSYDYSGTAVFTHSCCTLNESLAFIVDNCFTLVVQSAGMAFLHSYFCAVYAPFLESLVVYSLSAINRKLV